MLWHKKIGTIKGKTAMAFTVVLALLYYVNIQIEDL